MLPVVFYPRSPSVSSRRLLAIPVSALLRAREHVKPRECSPRFPYSLLCIEWPLHFTLHSLYSVCSSSLIAQFLSSNHRPSQALLIIIDLFSSFIRGIFCPSLNALHIILHLLHFSFHPLFPYVRLFFPYSSVFSTSREYCSWDRYQNPRLKLHTSDISPL